MFALILPSMPPSIIGVASPQLHSLWGKSLTQSSIPVYRIMGVPPPQRRVSTTCPRSPAGTNSLLLSMASTLKKSECMCQFPSKHSNAMLAPASTDGYMLRSLHPNASST